MKLDILESAQKQSEVCGVFGNPYRVLIVWTLGKREDLRDPRIVVKTAPSFLMDAEGADMTMTF